METERKYDFCFSLGGSCAGALQLSLRNLRIAASPFDWVRPHDAVRYVETVATLLENRFRGWCALENLVPMPEDLDYPKSDDPLEVRAWDKVQDIGFFHDFRFDIFGRDAHEYYEGIVSRYKRRIDRLYDILSCSSKTLAVVVGACQSIPVENLRRLLVRMRTVFCGNDISLAAVCFNAQEDRTEGGLDDGLLVRYVSRKPHPYDFTKTSFEWDFLDGVSLTGRIAPAKEGKRNATKGMSLYYRLHRKLFLHCKKVLAKANGQRTQ